MSIQKDLKRLFQHPAALDRLNFLQLLFEGSELNHELALALLKVVHKELGNPPRANGSVYKQYAEMIQLLQHYQPEMLQQVVDAWKSKDSSALDEWFSHDDSAG